MSERIGHNLREPNMWMAERVHGYSSLDWVRDDGLFDGFQHALSGLNGNARTLIDLGTGSGAVLTRLGANFETAIGVDFSDKMLREIPHRTDLNMHLVQASITEGLPFPSEIADLVTERMMLHDLSSPEDAVEEAWRLVKPGGALAFSEYITDTAEASKATSSIAVPVASNDSGISTHQASPDLNAFIRGLFELKHEPERHLWSAQDFLHLVSGQCRSSSVTLTYSRTMQRVGNWLEKSGYPVDQCKQIGLLACMGADESLKREWGLEIYVDGRVVENLDEQNRLCANYLAASPDMRESMAVEAVFPAVFATVSVGK